MPVYHAKVSGVPDGSNTSLVRPSDWNDGHIIDVDLETEVSGILPYANGGFSDAAAQAAVGSILTDTARIDLTYNNTLNTISSDLVLGSITSAYIDSADAANFRTVFGLGTIATQNSNSVAITGGTISGIAITSSSFSGSISGSTIATTSITGGSISNASISGGSISSAGITSSSFSGSITSSTISGGTISSATISSSSFSGTITSATISSSSFSGTITGTSITTSSFSGTISGSTITSSSFSGSFSNNINANGYAIGNLDSIRFYTNPSFISTGANNGNVYNLCAYDVDGSSDTNFITFTAGNVPTCNLSDSVTKAGNYIYRAGGTTVSTTDGGTGINSYTAGDILYASATNILSKLSGNSSTTKEFLSQTGTGTVPGAPVWSTVTKSDVGLSAVENTAISTWGGSTNIVTLGTIATGTWSASTIAVDKGGTGQTSYTNGQLLIGNTTGNTLTKATLTQGTGVTITNGTGSITIGIGQAVATTSTPQFSRMGLGQAADATYSLATTGDIAANSAGSGFRVKEGSNARMGTASLVVGTATVSTTVVTANSRIFLTCQSPGGTPGFLRVSARVAGTSFTITSSSVSDTSTVGWIIFEPA